MDDRKPSDSSEEGHEAGGRDSGHGEASLPLVDTSSSSASSARDDDGISLANRVEKIELQGNIGAWPDFWKIFCPDDDFYDLR
jgi:hypothetical protein